MLVQVLTKGHLLSGVTVRTLLYVWTSVPMPFLHVGDHYQVISHVNKLIIFLCLEDSTVPHKR